MGTSLVSIKLYLNERDKKIRIQGNQQTMLQNMIYLKAKNGSLIADNGVLKHTNNELRTFYPKIVDKIDKLDLKLSQVKSYTETGFETVRESKTYLFDSIIFDTVPVKCFNYPDKWISFEGCINKDTIFQSIKIVDTLSCVLYDTRKWFRRKIMFWTKEDLRIKLVSANPYSTINYNQHIELTNKKGE
jgi:hypothetical protein